MRSVVVVRHGERLDYVMRDNGQNWIPTADRPWDPPLTEQGHEQANALAKALPKILDDLKLPPMAAIYSSPFWRCRQTAAGLIMDSTTNLRVQVELGLAESINENWYRSWAVPGTDGTWGYQKQEIPLTELDASTLHPAAKDSVAKILDWKQAPADDAITAKMDSDHVSKSKIDSVYCMDPPSFESFKMQRSRMYETLELLSSDHNDQTIVLVSHGRCYVGYLLIADIHSCMHAYQPQALIFCSMAFSISLLGGPVTHLFESLTGQLWDVHGVSKFCSYSIYRQADGDDSWEPLVVNRVLEMDRASEETSATSKTFTWA
jgi:broad specificity phosphatase PhoE